MTDQKWCIVRLHGDESDTTVPLDILRILSEKYGLKIEDLSRLYIRGYTDARNERQA